MENHRADQVLGSSADTPFEQGIARLCGSTTTYQAVGSPSLPNYLAAVSGDTQHVDDDDYPAAHPISADNLFRQVRAEGGTARSYEESMSGTCKQTSDGLYAVKHNPEAYFVDAADRDACQRENVPLGTLTAGPLHDDLVAGRLPTFAFITPNMCNDTHDCDVATGDRWLADWVGLITDSDTFRAGATAVFVVWDEPTPMPMLVIAPAVPPGTTSTLPWDHYSLLRTTEEMLGIPELLGNAATATSMRDTYGL